MTNSDGATPLFSPICVTNPTKTQAQNLNPFAALKTSFWISPGMTIHGFKEIQVPCVGGECQFDYVFTVRPKMTRKSFYKFRGNLVELHGFELKMSKSDLVRDSKFWSYLGLTNYFSFAVTSSMVPIAIEKVKMFPQIGIVDIETMQVIKAAKRVDILPSKREQILSQLLF
jgi:hypothetical protein